MSDSGTALVDDLVARLQGASPDERVPLVDEAYRSTEGMAWIPNPGPQTDAYWSEADILLYGGQAAGGKGLRPDAPVLTPFGWREIGSLKVGDAVCAIDGTTSRVIARFDRGVQPLYRLTFFDGCSIECDADHIWLAWRSSGYRKIKGEITTGYAGARKYTTADLAKHYADGNKGRFAIPVLDQPASFTVAGSLSGPGVYQRRVIPPYTLGVLLGDGYLGDRAVKFTTADDEIASRVSEELGVGLSAYQTESAATDYRIPNAACMDDLRALGLLGERSGSKFIPRIYQLGSVEERWALLQGLMDTDGTVSKGRAAYYTTVSKALADDVASLARSLGAIVSTTSKVPSYSYEGEQFEGREAFTLRIKMPGLDRMFHLERKRRLCAGKRFQSKGRAISSIVPAGEGETICIAVSHPSSLFITKDFIVTHNTDLLAGLALTQHRRSLLMRRQYTDLGYLIERVREVDGSWTGFNGSPPPRLRTLDKRLIDFGAALNLGDEEHWQGHPHDFIGFDEVVHFLEAQVRFLMGWNRSAVQGQRSRVVMASNPPANPDGDWIISMFAPWLDQNHQLYGQVKPGELVWYVTDPDGKDFITPGPEPYHFPGDKTPAGEDRWLTPRSRTFVPASLEDNIFQRGTGYESQLDNLPEPLRSILRDGNFMLAREDDPWQLIPTSWIQEAQDRWRPQRPEGVAMTAMALDPTGGGSDHCAIARRYDGWFSEIISVPGYEIKDEEMAGLVVQHRRDNCVVVIDMGGGYGGVPYMMLQDNLGDNGGVEDLVYAYKGAEGSTARDESRKMAFENKRTESWWRFREALNPGREGGSGVSLPPDQTLLSDLASVKFTTKAKAGVLTIVAEKKADVVKRLGRSPDHGDAVVMCWTKGGATVTGQRLVPRDQRVGARNGGPKAVTSRDRNTGSRRRR